MRWKNGLWLLVTGLLVLAGGCHLIVGIRDAEPYPTDASAGAGGTTACTSSQTQVCYGGSEQTEGVGVCKSGTQTCTSEGEWGACEGEILPGTEDCSAPADEDCNGYACSETLWVKQFGVQSTSANPTDVAVDRQTGDIYVTGSFSGALPVGSDTLDAQSANNAAFLAKFDGQGTPLWAKQFGNVNDPPPVNTIGSSVVVDGQGNVVLVGTASTAVNLGGDDLPGGVFIGKFAPSGQTIWSQACQTTEYGFSPPRVAVDPISNDVVIAGAFAYSAEPVTCGNVSLMGSSDVVVSRFAALDGSVVFAKEFSSDNGFGAPNDVAVDEQGSILLTGLGKNLNFGGPSLTGGYVAKLASNGSHVWSKGFGDGVGVALSLDTAGGLAIAGSGGEAGPLNFGGEDLLPLGQTDLFVATLDGLGNHAWSRRFGSPGDNKSSGRDIAIDSKGNLAVAGRVYGNVTIDGTILAGDGHAFAAKFDVNGVAAWSKTFGRERCYVAFSSLDELVGACQSTVAADFGKGLATPAGESDLFLLKIAP